MNTNDDFPIDWEAEAQKWERRTKAASRDNRRLRQTLKAIHALASTERSIK